MALSFYRHMVETTALNWPQWTKIENSIRKWFERNKACLQSIWSAEEFIFEKISQVLTLCCISLGRCCFGLETRVIIKISKNPSKYPLNVDCFSLKQKKNQNQNQKKNQNGRLKKT